MADHETISPWRRFWEKGGWWRSLLLVAVYWGLYQLLGLPFAPLLAATDDPAMRVFIGTGLPILAGFLVLVVFSWSMGWLRELFGPQQIRGRWWMWIAVAIVLLFNALHFATIDYSAAGAGMVVAWLVTGVFVGLAEETLTRGLVVNMMRKAGYREIAVAAVSAALFAAMHAGNLFSGADLFATGMQVVYTFSFGILMYLVLRVGGSLLWPILLHATTDPSIFLHAQHHVDSPLSTFAGLGNVVVIFAGLILLIFIRGRVEQRAVPGLEHREVQA